MNIVISRSPVWIDVGCSDDLLCKKQLRILLSVLNLSISSLWMYSVLITDSQATVYHLCLLMMSKVDTFDSRTWKQHWRWLLRNKGQRSRKLSLSCHLNGRLPRRWMKNGLMSLSQVVHCNPAEVAYRAHCLSHCCLSSFPKTDSSPRTHTHTHTTPSTSIRCVWGIVVIC